MSLFKSIEENKTINYWGNLVLEEVGLSKKDLCSAKRTRTLANKKIMVYYFLNKLCGYSLTEVGYFCNKDHSTVKKLIKKYQKELETEVKPRIQYLIECG